MMTNDERADKALRYGKIIGAVGTTLLAGVAVSMVAGAQKAPPAYKTPLVALAGLSTAFFGYGLFSHFADFVQKANDLRSAPPAEGFAATETKRRNESAEALPSRP